MVQAISTNTFGVAKWVVSADATQGTHTTISGATASATSGDTIFIRNGIYTENVIAKAGVNYAALTGDAGEPTVTIIGTFTHNTAGIVSLSNLRLQTNSANIIVVSGSAASILEINDCYFNCTNNTGISMTSSGGAVINCYNCLGNLGTTGIAYFACTAGDFQLFDCDLTNSGSSVTANTFSGSTLTISSCRLLNGITTSGSTAFGNIANSTIGNINLNVTSFTHGSTSATPFYARISLFTGGTSSAISVGTGSVLYTTSVTVDSSNTNAVTGAGTIRYTPISFTNTSSTINTSTATRIPFGPNAYIPTGVTFDNTNVLQNYVTSTSFTPTLTGSTTAGTTTYSTQAGSYIRIGNLVTVFINLIGSSATGTGNAMIGGLPFTVKAVSTYNPVGTFSCANAAGWVWPALTTHIAIQALQNTTTAQISCSGSGAAAGALQMANAAFNMTFGLTYEI